VVARVVEATRLAVAVRPDGRAVDHALYNPPVSRIARPVPTAALVLAGALAACIITVERMRGMDAGPGTDLGGLGWYVGIWVTMMAAMMLPSVMPMTLFFARIARDRGRASTPVFVAGYLAVWTGYGLLAYGLYRFVHELDRSEEHTSELQSLRHLVCRLL